MNGPANPKNNSVVFIISYNIKLYVIEYFSVSIISIRIVRIYVIATIIDKLPN